jgi:GNAT superfamily N-acetyltransferase/catechol 2,3-dioxygenase-like lactoylglutathione lyase family enzyme
VDALALLESQFAEHAISLSRERLEAGVRGLLDHELRGAVVLAREERRPVGVAVLTYTWTLEHGGQVAWLEELYVAPDRRGKGIGGALLDHVRELARAAGCQAIDLEVTKEHGRAERLYERSGFRPLHRARWSLPLHSQTPPLRLQRPPASIDHISIGVNDLARSRVFYDAALAPLGLVPYPQPTGDVGYGPSMDPPPIEGFALFIGFEDPSAKRPVVPSAGFHVALRAPSREAVRQFHRAALAHGGRDHGAPGLRPQYHDRYYGAFALDPDGHNIEAVFHAPEPGEEA